MVKLDFDIVLVGYLLETKKGYKNLKKQEVEHIFIKTNWTKSVFKIVWLKVILTLFRMGHLGDAHGWGAEICHTYHTITKLDIVIPYLKKIQNIYMNHVIPLEFC